MRSLTIIAVLLLLVSGFAGAQSAESEAECPCKLQDQTWHAYDDPVKLAELIASPTRTYLLLDVRGPADYEQGHIPTAVNLPLATLYADGVGVPRDSLVIVYCASGTRSGMAARYLAEQGYTAVIDFGSISRWQGALDVGP